MQKTNKKRCRFHLHFGSLARRKTSPAYVRFNLGPSPQWLSARPETRRTFSNLDAGHIGNPTRCGCAKPLYMA